MGGDRNDRRPRGHGGSKRKFIQVRSSCQEHAVTFVAQPTTWRTQQLVIVVQAFGGDKTVAIPYGKQGILVTLLSPNLSRAGREAVNIFTEARLSANIIRPASCHCCNFLLPRSVPSDDHRTSVPVNHADNLFLLRFLRATAGPGHGCLPRVNSIRMHSPNSAFTLKTATKPAIS